MIKKFLKVTKALLIIFSIIIIPSIDVACEDVPKTLKNFKAFHDDRRSQIIRENGYNLKDVELVENFFKKSIEQNDFSIAIELESINSIIESNSINSSVERFWEFMNDTDCQEPISRRCVTPEFFNVDIKELEGKDYEKYGFLSCKDKKQDFTDNEVNKYYGKVFINFKKENLINRTTLTVGDSLNLRHKFGKNSVTPTLVNSPCIVGIPGYSKQSVEFIANAIREKRILPNRPNMISKLNDPVFGFAYFELQFHGDLIFSRDVESVDIIKTIGEEELEQEVVAKLETMEIPCNVIDCTDVEASQKSNENQEAFEQWIKINGYSVGITAPAGVFKPGSTFYAYEITLEDTPEEYALVTKDIDPTVAKEYSDRIGFYNLKIIYPDGITESKELPDWATLHVEVDGDFNPNEVKAVRVESGSDVPLENIERYIKDDKVFFKGDLNHFSRYALMKKESFNFITVLTISLVGTSLICVIVYIFLKKRKVLHSRSAK